MDYETFLALLTRAVEEGDLVAIATGNVVKLKVENPYAGEDLEYYDISFEELDQDDEDDFDDFDEDEELDEYTEYELYGEEDGRERWQKRVDEGHIKGNTNPDD